MWQPILPAQSLEFGLGYHIGMQTVYDPATWDDTTPSQKLIRAIDAFTGCCNKQRDQYLLATSQTRLTWDGRDDYANRVELGKRMLEHYVLNIHPVEDKGLKPVKTEIKFRVPLLDKNGEPLRCWSSPTCGQIHEPGAAVVVEGRVDVILEDTLRGGYYLGDWKTIGGDKAIDGMEKNTDRFSDPSTVWTHDQLSTYCWAFRYVLNLDVRGFILAEIRKDYPKPPARLQNKRNGGIFSTNRSMATTLELYKNYVTEHDPEGYATGAYDGYLDYLGSKDAPRFHQRFRIEKSPAELKHVGEYLAEEISDMISPDVRIYPEPGPFVCRKCTYRSPCDMIMRGMDYMFTLESGYQQVPRV